MIRIGTSGYSYEDWVGPFYPEGTPKNKFLDHYQKHFDVVEVNYTYYTMPNPRTLTAMSAKTGPTFRFVVKANRQMTHEPGEDLPGVFQEFVAALEPLRQQGKFGCVLAQFPNSFKCTKPSVQYLREFSELTAGVPVVVEFRNRGWIRDETFEFLREQDFGFCCVDQPQFDSLVPPVAEATSAISYVRFHGRNYDKWWEHEEAWERYNYLYSKEELSEWVDKVKGLAAGTEDTYLFFNNHYNAQAVQNAMDFAELLEEAGVG
jgi:uncharacterized protein YecE (DUF72 family)